MKNEIWNSRLGCLKDKKQNWIHCHQLTRIMRHDLRTISFSTSLKAWLGRILLKKVVWGSSPSLLEFWILPPSTRVHLSCFFPQKSFHLYVEFRLHILFMSAGALVNPNGITLNSYKPRYVWKAVLCLFSSFTLNIHQQTGNRSVDDIKIRAQSHHGKNEGSLTLNHSNYQN